MAIVEMKKMTLLAMKKDKQRLMRTLQHMGCVQVVEREPDEGAAQDAQSDQRIADLQKNIARLDLAVVRLNPYDQNKRGLLSLRPEAGEDQVTSALATRTQTMEVIDRLEEIERTRGELRSREARESALIEHLAQWEALDVPLNRLGDTQTSRLFLAAVPLKAWTSFMDGVAALGAASAQQVSAVREVVNAFVAVHKAKMPEMEGLMREVGASRVQFEGIDGTPALAMDNTRAKLDRIAQVRAQLQGEVERMAEQLPSIRLLRDIEATELSRQESSARCVDTQSAFLLTGWTPATETEKLEAALKKASPVCQIEFDDPLPDEQPPTMLKNTGAISPFESIVKMFSTPDPRGIDPTLVMMPFWICFFGMMVSDAGYGVVMGLAATFVWWKLRGKGLGRMAFILALGGLSTVIWGSIYGGWFGATPYKPLLDPMNDAIKVLVVCVVAGFVHLVAGMAMSAYMSIKRGRPWDALFDQGFWLMVLVGFALMLVNTGAGGMLAAIGGLGILCTAGRRKKNLLGKITGGLGALYGITSYVSDLLSYARLFGMGLATGVIGMVINMLAGLLMGNPIGWVFAIVVLVGMHTFNLFINALGAYVHACRLQFIEFFGKFYESGGVDFRPLSNQTRYVDIAGGQQ